MSLIRGDALTIPLADNSVDLIVTSLPESVQDRVRRSHEQWFHFTLEPRYYSAVDEIREAYDDTPGAIAKRRDGQRVLVGHGDPRWVTSQDRLPHENPLGKLPGSVWTVPTEPLQVPDHLPQHFAAFPSEWPRRIILGWSPEDGTVLDPFAGTGTVPAVANALGRYGVGIDLSADYLRLARWRLNDPGLRAKALQVDKPSPEVPGQMALL